MVMPAGNPFYVAPGNDYSQALSGFTGQINQLRTTKKKEDFRQEAIKKADAIRQEAVDAYKSGDPNKMYELAVKYPSLSKGVETVMNFKNEKTKNNYFESAMEFLQNPTPENAQRITAGRQALLQSEGATDTQHTDTFMDKFKANPQEAIKDVQMTLPAVMPKRWKAYQDALNSENQTDKNLSAGYRTYLVANGLPNTPENYQKYQDFKTSHQQATSTQYREKYRRIKSREATGKPVSAEDLAWARAYESERGLTALVGQGLNPDGSLSEQGKRLAQLIAEGKVDPISGFALSRPGGQAIMGEVKKINPNYDATTYWAKKDASKKFTAGALGVQLRSFSTASRHLDQLEDLTSALHNKDMTSVNRLANFVKKELGVPAPTNFDAIKGIVGKEVVKAIVAGGGGVTERNELEDQLSNAKSPAQLLGVIRNWREVMGVQLENLVEQRRAAGLSDANLPQYTKDYLQKTGNLKEGAGADTTRAQYDALPSGAIYIKNGKKYRKP